MRPACQQLAAMRQDQPHATIDSHLIEQFKQAVTESEKGNKESAQLVVLLGAQLLAQGGPFVLIHPKMKAAGYFLRDKKDPKSGK